LKDFRVKDHASGLDFGMPPGRKLIKSIMPAYDWSQSTVKGSHSEYFNLINIPNTPALGRTAATVIGIPRAEPG